MNAKILSALVAVIAVAAVGWYLQREPAELQADLPVPIPAIVPAPAPVQRDEPIAPTEVDPRPLVAAPLELNDSDGNVGAAIAELAPRMVAWVTPAEQIRRWVALVDQMAEGKLPLKNRPLSYPMAAFKADTAGGKMRMDTANYARAEVLVDTVTAIPPGRLAQYYNAWRPTLDKAYAELGGSGSFDKRLRAAIQRVLAVQPLPAQPALERPSVYYRYADAQLERASDVEKLMWRLGPANSKRVQDYLRTLQRQL